MSDVAAIVLCGGTSRRMGVADKTALPFAGSTVLNHLLDSLPEDWPVVCVGPRRPTRRTVAWTRESPPGAGPVAGLAAGLALVTAPVCVLLAGDLPFAGPAARELANWFLGSGHPKSDAGPSVVDGVAAIDGARRTQPLLAAYRAAALRAALPTDPAGARVMSIVQRLRLETRQCSDLACLDVDTPEALARARDAAEHKADPQCDPASPGTEPSQTDTLRSAYRRGMKAITIPTPGGPDALVLADVPTPVPGAGEVVVDVIAAGVNRADLMQRQGFYDPPAGESAYPGLEVSGTISALGEDVTGWQVGDQVCALLTGGGYAEQVAVPVGQLLPVPDGVSLEDAAALPEVACTVWSNIFMTADLQPGQTVLIHGGSSGIGTMAIQLAREVGARVAVTAGSQAKLDACRELGAEITINYREQDFVEVLADATDGHGADVILDNMGAKYLERNLAALATGGRLVIIGLQGGTKAELNINTLLRKRGSVIATSLRARSREEKAAIVTAVREHVWPLVASGLVHPVIHARFALADAADAHRALDASQHIGKVLLTI